MLSLIASPFQDGAGRVGKMLFARQGKKFDYDLKQVKYENVMSCAQIDLSVNSGFTHYC